ncbi:hypothetical protein GA0115254_115035 [Streptomyces sp. Ncost-T10-10d]|nr:hypothetical protein GA0115254_115035 [Streptomyces sp. Ncost-T10-10d]
MQRNAKTPLGPSFSADRKRGSVARHLRKWLVSRGQSVHTSFMCGVAYRAGDFATGLVIAWLIARY